MRQSWAARSLGRSIFVLFSFLFLSLLLSGQATATLPPPILQPDPGKASVEITGSKVTIGNEIFRGEFSVEGGKLAFARFTSLLTQQTLPSPGEVFSIRIKDGREIPASEMSLVSAPVIEDLPINERASRWSERFPGKKVSLVLRSQDTKLTVAWSAILRDGSNYLRQQISVRAPDQDISVSEIRLVGWKVPGARVVGTVAGSPVVAGGIFAGFEHPLSRCRVADEKATCSFSRELPLRVAHEVTFSSVIGATPPDQLRRGFLNYVERERAHPYRTFLHYNTWYDLGYFGRFDQAAVLDRVHVFGQELHELRGVTLDSFLLDDGWDDPKTLWHFNPGFPQGLSPITDATATLGAAPGIWMSPWGGYGEPHDQRLKYGKDHGFEANAEGFALSGPKYYALFHEVCMQMMSQYGVNQFKFDGTGNVNVVIPGSEFDSDFAAAIRLIEDLRVAKPDVYINLTTGTYPSPFWLQYADSIWRGGDDHSFAGVGSWRQKWITYRDADTYQHVVSAGPLYPLNALMLHGLIYAQHAKNLGADPGNDFSDEVHDYFGTGTQLQEMYITPSLLTKDNWDTLAEAANWSRRNANVLRDTHWVGGDPAKLELYGWASWSPEKAILVLRNPSNKPQELPLDVGRAFEIPPGQPRQFTAKSPWAKDQAKTPIRLQAGAPHTFALAPFEVLILEAMPIK